MKKIPTDLEILTEIYNRYEDTFRSYATEDPDRIARIRVPIDITEVAEEVADGEGVVAHAFQGVKIGPVITA